LNAFVSTVCASRHFPLFTRHKAQQDAAAAFHKPKGFVVKKGGSKGTTTGDAPDLGSSDWAYTAPPHWTFFTKGAKSSASKLSPKKLRQIILFIYREKIKTDIHDSSSGASELEELPQFVAQFFMSQYGAKSVVQSRLLGLINGLRAPETASDPWVLLFARFSGSGVARGENSTEGQQYTIEVLAPMLFFLAALEKKGSVFELDLTSLKKDQKYYSKTLQVDENLGHLPVVLYEQGLQIFKVAQSSLALRHVDGQDFAKRLKKRSFKYKLKADKLVVGLDHVLVSFVELVLRNQEAQTNTLAQLFRAYDADGNGTLDYDEFKCLIWHSIKLEQGIENGSQAESEHPIGSIDDMKPQEEMEIRRLFINAVSAYEGAEINEDIFVALAKHQLKKYIEHDQKGVNSLLSLIDGMSDGKKDGQTSGTEQEDCGDENQAGGESTVWAAPGREGAHEEDQAWGDSVFGIFGACA
jgi:hypothetical protein